MKREGRTGTRIGRHTLGIAAAGALVAGLCHCGSGGAAGEAGSACDTQEPMGQRIWLSREPRKTPVKVGQLVLWRPDLGSWERAHAYARRACIARDQSSVGGFLTGRTRERANGVEEWELVCLTQGAWPAKAIMQASAFAAPAAPGLEGVAWAEAGRAAQAACRNERERAEAGMPVAPLGAASYQALCLGPGAETREIGEHEIQGFSQGFDDWRAMGALAARLCADRDPATTGFFTGGRGTARDTYALVCVPVRDAPTQVFSRSPQGR
jgi:hypothetical protein